MKAEKEVFFFCLLVFTSLLDSRAFAHSDSPWAPHNHPPTLIPRTFGSSNSSLVPVIQPLLLILSLCLEPFLHLS